MKRYALALMFGALLTSACGSHNPAAPSIDVTPVADNGVGTLRTALTVPSNTWTGTTQALDGPTGTVTLVFGEDGSVTWTGVTGTFHGTVTGTLEDMTITGTGPAQGCVYHAFGSVSNGIFTGGYDLSGGNCIDKSGHGRFVVRQGAPVLVCGPYSLIGPATFELPNAGDATELAYVQAHVTNGSELSGPVKVNGDGTAYVADGSPVILIKSAQTYGIYLNVAAGTILSSPSSNGQGRLQDISHISLFSCGGVR